MGVYIKGMDMPNRCFGCPLYREGFGIPDRSSYCCVSAADARPFSTRRAEGCPLIHVPDHGDLIDRNMLIGGFADWYIQESPTYLGDDNTVAETIGDAMKAIEDAPVVIPAERSDRHSIDTDAEAEYLIDKFAKMWKKAEDSYTGDNRYAVIGIPEERNKDA